MGGHQVMVIALAHADAHSSEPDRLETLMDVGRAPVELALKPDGGEIFASNSLSDSVSEIYNTNDEVGDTYMIGASRSSGSCRATIHCSTWPMSARKK